jgi:hypothetical protein
VTLEGATVAATFVGIHTAKHIAQLSAITFGNIVTPGMGWATYYITACAFDVFCCAKTLLQVNKSYRKEKKERKRQAAIPALPTQEAGRELVFAEATAVFNNEAAPDKAAKKPVPKMAVQAKRASSSQADKPAVK